MSDKTPIKIIALIVVPLLLAIIVRFAILDNNPGKSGEVSDSAKSEFMDIGKKSDLKVMTSWLLPAELLEVSGISWLDADHFACVQDELGKIYLFNVRLNTIDKEISFGPPGDYEGIALVGNDAYVLRADGTIFGVANYMSDKPTVKMYQTHLKKKQDSESLCFDKKNNRLLVVVKAQDPGSEDYKGIYAFDLTTKSMLPAPVYKIDLTHAIFGNLDAKARKNAIRPSDIDVHPITGDLYILEGTKPKLLVMSTKGAMLALHDLKRSDFRQPEGIAFSPDGKMFISNEGDKEPGNILQVEIREKAQ